MADLMPMIHAERRSLSDFLGTLTPDQWSTPTCCTQWNVQQLVGHLVAAANVTAPHFFGGLVKQGFSFDKFVDGDLRPYAAGTPSEVKQRFDGIITSTRTPPGPKYVALGEVMVHGEDIRRAFGVKGEHPVDHLTTLAELYKKTGAPFRAKKRLVGPRAARHRRRLVDGRRAGDLGAGDVADPRHGRRARARSTIAPAPASTSCADRA